MKKSSTRTRTMALTSTTVEPYISTSGVRPLSSRHSTFFGTRDYETLCTDDRTLELQNDKLNNLFFI